jgi:cell division protein FtsB
MSSQGAKSRAVARQSERRAADERASRPVLTGRAALLALVLTLLVFTLAVPTRELFAQRADLAAIRDSNDTTSARISALQAEKNRLSDPTYVGSLIRERLHYVLPGEVGYVVLAPDDSPAQSVTSAAQTSDTSWYQRLVTSLQTADGATPTGTDSGRIVISPTAPR